jgi:hypothetical protein
MCMDSRRIFGFLLLVTTAPLVALASKPSSCVSVEDAGRLLNRDICISAHIYDVVQLADGTRYLDVCPPQTSDENCRFTIMSLWQDRDDVGELTKYRDMDVQVRGLVRPMHGRAGMLLSHARQFHGGPPKFQPNPKLARGFDAGEDRPPVRDPNLRSQGSPRNFMNTRDQETRTAK